MKIQLIRPPLDDWYPNEGQFTGLESPPIGLAIIAKAVKDAEVEILDGKDLSIDEIAKELNGDIIGTTDIYSNHKNALEILRQAKSKGAVTFIGGPNVTHLAENILRNHEYVDYTAVGDGEVALSMFVSGENKENIPNLVYRGHGQIIRNKIRNAPLNILFDLEDILNLTLDIEKAVSISSIRGCIKAEKQRRCSFCSMDNKLNTMHPELVWQQIRILHEKYGAAFFWETGDSFIVGDFPQRLIAARPDDLRHIQFKMYTSPDQLNEVNVKTLGDLNARDIYVGIESVNDLILKRANKSYTISDIEDALYLLEEQGISPIHVPFIYGLPGETQKTAEESFRFAEKLARKHPDMKIVSSLPIPFPGTQLFNNLRNNQKAREEYPGDLYKDDFFDYKKLIQIQTKYFTSVDYDTLCTYIGRTRQLISKEGNVTSFYINE